MKVIIVLVALVCCVLGASVPINQLPGFGDLFAEHGGMIAMNELGIVGGNETTIENFPWIVSIQYLGKHRCGASIISPNCFLTAAHCTHLIPVSAFQLRAGSTNNKEGGQLVQVSKIINHPEYDPRKANNDIGIMWISGSLDMSAPGVSVIRLPAQDAPVANGAMANVTGWGILCTGCPAPKMLRFVSVPIVSNAECKTDYPPVLITDAMLCAGFPHGGRDACQGDSGGPLNMGNIIVGVVSWGGVCAVPRSPGVYARVALFRNWINSNM